MSPYLEKLRVGQQKHNNATLDEQGRTSLKYSGQVSTASTGPALVFFRAGFFAGSGVSVLRFISISKERLAVVAGREHAMRRVGSNFENAFFLDHQQQSKHFFAFLTYPILIFSLTSMRRSCVRLMHIVDRSFVENLPKPIATKTPHIVPQPVSQLEPRPTRLVDTLLAEQSIGGPDWPPNLRVEPAEKNLGLVKASVAIRMKKLLTEEPPVHMREKKKPLWSKKIQATRRRTVVSVD